MIVMAAQSAHTASPVVVAIVASAPSGIVMIGALVFHFLRTRRERSEQR